MGIETRDALRMAFENRVINRMSSANLSHHHATADVVADMLFVSGEMLQECGVLEHNISLLNKVDGKMHSAEQMMQEYLTEYVYKRTDDNDA